MADSANTPGGGSPGPAPAGTQAAAAPRLAVVTQYVKDLSFENPMAPQALLPGGPRPEIGVRVNVGVHGLDAERHEVVLTINVEAKAGEQVVFMLELAYAGVFGLSNIPVETAQPLLLIECPRLLFPFARRVVADVTRDGGFPPLMVEPIDFASLFRRRLQQQQQQQQAQAAAAAGNRGETTV
ncbi:MAG TPA: protein-export chaperone SecB [Geminicoccaceae bacterium]|nr:protein-export chaperone SecB [Geminicoccaceae bacterium]